MSAPVCPPDYTCQFTIVHPRTVIEHVGPWWHTWMLPALIVAVAAMIVLATTNIAIGIQRERHRRRIAQEQNQREEAERRHRLAMEEQKTMQMDTAKGDPETLKQMRRILG